MRRARLAILAAAAVLALLLLFHRPILQTLAHALISTDKLRKADAILVLAGGTGGDRILYAAKLAKQGFAPKVVMSGPTCCYDNNESDLAIGYAVRKGEPRELFVSTEIKAHSTKDEAQQLAEVLRGMNVRTVLLVTSNYHTRRAGKIFRQAVPDIEFIVVGSPDQDFDPDNWWLERDSQKIFYYEWSKTFAELAGI